MENLSLTNADLVEIDEYLVERFNSSEIDTRKISFVNKKELLEASNSWNRISLDSSFFDDCYGKNYYMHHLSEKFKNRYFEVFYRIEVKKGKYIQYFDRCTTDYYGVLTITIPGMYGKKEIGFDNVVDIWYRLVIPPTGQYSKLK